jgi:DNA mismatch endonuclease, patch repair protein
LTDTVSSSKRSEMMAGIKGRDTKPELQIRRLLHRLGYRFRLHWKDLPGRPDIVLHKYRTAIFVHGCFWHGHDDCSLFRLPRSRENFWAEKIAANRTRDAQAEAAIRELGWKNITVWECAMKGKSALAGDRLIEVLLASIASSNEDSEIRGSKTSKTLENLRG